MKIISFFSKLAVLCNISFLLFIFFAWRESGPPASAGKDILVAVPFLKDIIITLGISAIIVNVIMCLVYAIVIITGRQKQLNKTLVIINFLFLISQVIYFFLR